MSVKKRVVTGCIGEFRWMIGVGVALLIAACNTAEQSATVATPTAAPIATVVELATTVPSATPGAAAPRCGTHVT